MKLEAFRADNEVVSALDALEEKLDRNRSDVLRRAVLHFAKANGIKGTA